MGLWKSFKDDMKALFPESLRIYDNKETGEFAFEVVNKPNSMGVPLVSRNYTNHKRGIEIHESTNNKGETGFWGNVRDKIGKKNLEELEDHRVI